MFYLFFKDDDGAGRFGRRFCGVRERRGFILLRLRIGDGRILHGERRSGGVLVSDLLTCVDSVV